jgi:hypothetical protein
MGISQRTLELCLKDRTGKVLGWGMRKEHSRGKTEAQKACMVVGTVSWACLGGALRMTSLDFASWKSVVFFSFLFWGQY